MKKIPFDPHTKKDGRSHVFRAIEEIGSLATGKSVDAATGETTPTSNKSAQRSNYDSKVNDKARTEVAVKKKYQEGKSVVKHLDNLYKLNKNGRRSRSKDRSKVKKEGVLLANGQLEIETRRSDNQGEDGNRRADEMGPPRLTSRKARERKGDEGTPRSSPTAVRPSAGTTAASTRERWFSRPHRGDVRSGSRRATAPGRRTTIPGGSGTMTPGGFGARGP